MKSGCGFFVGACIEFGLVFNSKAIHEHINKMLGKISGLTYEAVRDRYENFRSRCLVEKQEEITNTEKGCTEPLLGKKAKCVLRIVPLDDPSPPFSINPKCVPKKITRKNKSLKNNI